LNWFGDANTNERYLLEIIRRGRRRIERILPSPSGVTQDATTHTRPRFDSEDFLSVFPEWRDTYHKVEKSYVAFISQVEGIYARLREIPARAQFAKEAKQYFFYGIVLAWKSEEEEVKTIEAARRVRIEGWRGIDAWEYYGGWGIKRLIRDMRELEERGCLVVKKNKS